MLIKKRQKTISVLLTASGGFGAPSYIDCLKNNYENRKVRVVCSDSVDQPIMHYKADGFHLLPKGNSKKYIQSLISLCKKERINVVIPCSGSEVFAISKNLNLLQSYNIYSTVPNFETVKKTSDKAEIYELLKKNGISVPDFLLVQNKYQFKKALKTLGYPRYPVCMKPSRYTSTGGSKGFRILRKKNSIDDIILNHKPGFPEIDYETSLRLFERKDSELMISEYLPGKEYSVHVLAKNGKILFISCFFKKRALYGISLESIIEKKRVLSNISNKIVNVMNYSYNMNIQFRLSRSGHPKVIEINPRVGGGISLPAASGINIPYMTVKMALNEKLPSKQIVRKTKLLRYWKELFVQNSKTFEYN